MVTAIIANFESWVAILKGLFAFTCKAFFMLGLPALSSLWNYAFLHLLSQALVLPKHLVSPMFSFPCKH